MTERDDNHLTNLYASNSGNVPRHVGAEVLNEDLSDYVGMIYRTRSCLP